MATTTYQLRTFDDIVDAVMEELKYQSSDTVSRNRIKRDVNMIYMNEVVPYEQWKWLRGHVTLNHNAYYTTGTASVTQNSTALTLSTAPSGSKRGHFFSVEGQTEIYRIAQHTASATAVVLDAPYIGSTDTDVTFKIWTDKLALPVDCRDTVSVHTDYMDVPLEGMGVQQFRRHAITTPKLEQRPRFYCTSDYVDPSPFSLISGLPALSTAASDGHVKTLVFASTVAAYLQAGDRIEVSGSVLHHSFNGEWVVSSVSTTTVTYSTTVAVTVAAQADASLVLKKDNNEKALERFKELWVYPSLYNQRCILHVDYTKEAAPLVEDEDEPLMPLGDRTVLLYGGLMRAWTRERNPEEANRNATLYQRKLEKMAGKLDDSTDLPILRTGKTWLAAKREVTRKRSSAFFRGDGFGGGTRSSTSPTDPITGTANSAAIYNADGELAASPTISTTELGRLDGILSTAVGISDTQTLTNKTIDASSNTISNIANTNISNSAAIAYSKLNLALSIVNADIATAAAIARSKIAAGTADHVVINAATTGVLSSEAQLDRTRGGTGVSSTATFPTSGVIVTEAATQTLSAKTLTTPVVNGIKNAVKASQTGNVTLATTDYYVPCNANGGAFTVTLPAVSGNTGLTYVIKKTDSTLNAVTIDGNGAETIEGAASTTLNTQYEAVTIVCDGSTWHIVDRKIPIVRIPYTPTGSFVTNSSYAGQYWRTGDSICFEIKVSTSGGVGTPGALTITNPSGVTFDTAKIDEVSNNYIIGTGSVWDNSATTTYIAFPCYNSTTTLAVQIVDDAAAAVIAGVVTHANPITFAADDYITIQTMPLPVVGWNG